MIARSVQVAHEQQQWKRNLHTIRTYIHLCKQVNMYVCAQICTCACADVYVEEPNYCSPRPGRPAARLAPQPDGTTSVATGGSAMSRLVDRIDLSCECILEYKAKLLLCWYILMRLESQLHTAVYEIIVRVNTGILQWRGNPIAYVDTNFVMHSYAYFVLVFLYQISY